MSAEQPAAEIDLRSVYAGLIAGGISGAVFGLIFGIGGAYLFLRHDQPYVPVAYAAPSSTVAYPTVPTMAATPGQPVACWTPNQPTMSAQPLTTPVYVQATPTSNKETYYTPTTSATSVPTSSYAPNSVYGSPVGPIPPASPSNTATTSYPVAPYQPANPNDPGPTPPSYAPPTPPSSQTPPPVEALVSPSTPTEPPVQEKAVCVRFYVNGYSGQLEAKTYGTPNRVVFEEDEFHADSTDGFLGYYEKPISSVLVTEATPMRFHVQIVDKNRVGKGAEGVVEVEYGTPAKRFRFNYDQQAPILAEALQ